MKIAKPLLLVTTPIGLAYGLYEGYRLAGGLVVIMAAMICVIAVAFGSVILTVRRERRQADSTRPTADSKSEADKERITGNR